MRVIMAMLLGLAFTHSARAEGESAGDFDYYVMSLSWSANWCALKGDDRGDAQCDTGRGLTFILHGLWPQYERGSPSFCPSGQRDPTRAETQAMSDVMGGANVAWYQWKKHGRCAGMPARDYLALLRRAYGSVVVPPIFAKISTDLKVSADVIEAAFVESNPGLARDQVTVTCTQGMIQEVRICLTPGLEPRRCGADVIRDCTMTDAALDAVR